MELALQYQLQWFKDVVTKLVADGKVTRGYLGVAIGDVDNELAKVYKRKEVL